MVKRNQDQVSGEEDNSKAHGSTSERPLSTKKTKVHHRGSDDSDEDKPSKTTKSKARAKPEAKAKAIKGAKPGSIKKPRIAGPESDVEAGAAIVGVNNEGERYVDLGKKKRATVRQFKGANFLDIREFYGDEDDLKPGKKGISLNQEQWESLKNSSDAIDAFFSRLKK